MNTVKQMTCVVCPVGCRLEVTLDENNSVLSVAGNTCPRGKRYAESECTHPVRTLTTTVALQSAEECRLPVKTSRPIAREKLFEAMAEAEQITVIAPVHRGDILRADFTEPGVNLIACKTVLKKIP